jgi:hypothetical protein
MIREVDRCFEYRLEHIMSYIAKLGTREVIGPVPEGLRANVHVIGGEVTGPSTYGKFCRLSGDWLTIRRDGVAILDVRATIETHDVALIFIAYTNTSDRGEDGYESSIQGQPMASGTAIYISPRFQTSHPDYVWLNRLHCLGIRRAFPERSEVAYNVYAVRQAGRDPWAISEDAFGCVRRLAREEEIVAGVSSGAALHAALNVAAAGRGRWKHDRGHPARHG